MPQKARSAAVKTSPEARKYSAQRWKTKEVIIPLVIALVGLVGAIIGGPLIERLWPTPKAIEATSIPQPQITPFPNRSGDKLFFSRNDDSFMMSLDGTYTTRVADNPAAYIYRPSITIDGETLLFTSNIEGHTDIYTINRDGSNLRNVTNSIGYDEIRGSWKPDKKQILFYRQYSIDSDILTIDADGKNETNLTKAFGGGPSAMNTIMPMAWAPDGSKFVFQSNLGGDYDIYVYDLSSRRIYQITDNATGDYKAAWSPDGIHIVYTSEVSGTNTDIFVADVANLDVLPKAGVNITNHPAHDTDASWSPDGSQIVFISNRDGNPEIYIMDMDGGNLKKITNTPEAEQEPQWIK